MDESRLPLTEHLAELRTRLVKAILAWIVASIVAWTWKEQIFAALLAPAVHALGGGKGHLQAIAPGEIFFTYMKGALLAGFVIALPVVLWQAWSFIAPGLYPTEKKFAVPFVVVSTLLFVIGRAVRTPVRVPDHVRVPVGLRERVRAVGVVDERSVQHDDDDVPRLRRVVRDARRGVLPGDAPASCRSASCCANFPYAVLACFILGAVLTPSTDWVSQTLLAVPMTVLYLLGVLAAWLFGGRRARATSSALTVTTPPS